MDIKTFLQAYESIVKGEADDAFIDQVFLDVFERIEGSYLEDDFNKAEDRIGKIMAIDKAAHYMHSKDPDILAFAFPEADAVLVKETLDRLSGLEAVSPVRKASRGYFTTFASVEGLTFLQKQVGELKANRATMDEIKADIEEYERLYKAGIVSHAELLVLSRFYGDKGQRYRDELKKGYPGEDPMVVGGYASVEVVDKEGHLITTEALTKAFDKFMKSFRTRNVNFAHSDVQAGWPLRVWINQKGEIYKSGVDDKGLYLVSEVRPDITIANKVEKEIEAGVIRSYSIAGSALDKSVETKGNRVIMVVNDLELAEISFCERPVNQESHFDIIKSLPSGKVLGEMLTKQQVLEALPKGELPLSDYTVCLVGRDLVIRADKDSFLGKAIKLALSQELPVGIKDNVKIIFEAEGPHSDYVPLWNIRLGPVSRQEVRLADLSKAGKQLIGMTDADLKKLGEKIGINFDTVSFKEFKMGLQIECEHYDVTEYDPEKTARIVLAHLRELPDYYTKLKGMENPQPTMPESIPEMGKGKVVDNEVGMKRPEDQNDIDVKKESSGLKDKSGSNEQVKQSPNVQTPVTKVGEVHCAETMKKGLKGLQEYVSKAQPPAMAPPRPGLIWDPIGHRWKKPQIGAGSDEYSWAQFEAGGKMYRVGHSAKSDQYIVDVNDGSRWHSIASGLKSSREAMDKIKQLSGTEPVAKSSTTRITSPALHPSLAIRHPKIRWGEPEKPVAKKSMTQSGMAGMAAFLDFIQDAENKSK